MLLGGYSDDLGVVVGCHLSEMKRSGHWDWVLGASVFAAVK